VVLLHTYTGDQLSSTEVVDLETEVKQYCWGSSQPGGCFQVWIKKGVIGHLVNGENDSHVRSTKDLTNVNIFFQHLFFNIIKPILNCGKF